MNVCDFQRERERETINPAPATNLFHLPALTFFSRIGTDRDRNRDRERERERERERDKQIQINRQRF